MLSPSLPTSSRDFLFPFLPAGMPRHNVVAFVMPRHDAESRKYPNQGNIGKGFSSGHTSRVPLLP